MIDFVKMVNQSRLTAFASRHYGVPAERMRVRAQPLRGGLESPALLRVTVGFKGRRAHPETFVAKCVSGRGGREYAAYGVLENRKPVSFAPRLLGVETTEAGDSWLYLEWISRSRAWPWADTAATARVLKQLARLHESLPVEDWSAALRAWDYEAEMRESAVSTLEAFEAALKYESLAPARRGLAALRRMVAALPELRRQILGASGGPAALHGDVHSGNAMIRSNGTDGSAVLLDWGRARPGSPFEDVCSWLQSLGFWEPEAKRRHDTLLQVYLRARGLPPLLNSAVREPYWLAGAANALAGALRYHIAGSLEGGSPAKRSEHVGAVRDWLRIIRRADACWRR